MSRGAEPAAGRSRPRVAKWVYVAIGSLLALGVFAFATPPNPAPDRLWAKWNGDLPQLRLHPEDANEPELEAHLYVGGFFLVVPPSTIDRVRGTLGGPTPTESCVFYRPSLETRVVAGETWHEWTPIPTDELPIRARLRTR